MSRWLRRTWPLSAVSAPPSPAGPRWKGRTPDVDGVAVHAEADTLEDGGERRKEEDGDGEEEQEQVEEEDNDDGEDGG